MSTNGVVIPTFLGGDQPKPVIFHHRRFGESLDPYARAGLLTAHSGRAALLLMQTVVDSSPATAGVIRKKFADVHSEGSPLPNQNTMRNWAEGYVDTGVMTVRPEKNRRLYQGTALSRELLPLVGFFHDFDSHHREQGVSVQNIFGRPNGSPATDNSQLRRVWGLRYVASKLQAGDDLQVSELAEVLKTEARKDYAGEVAKRLARVGLFELNDWSVTEETIYETAHKGQRPKLIASAGDVLRHVVDYAHNKDEISREELHSELIEMVPAYAGLDPAKQKMALANVLGKLEAKGMLHKVHGRFTDGTMEIDATEEQRVSLSELLTGLDEFAGKSKEFIDKWGAYAISLAHTNTELIQMLTGFVPAENGRHMNEDTATRVLKVIRDEGTNHPIGSAEITELIAEVGRLQGSRVYDRQTVDRVLRELLASGTIQATTVNQGRGFTVASE